MKYVLFMVVLIGIAGLVAAGNVPRTATPDPVAACNGDKDCLFRLGAATAYGAFQERERQAGR